jgi:C4-dicarboxylate-specific signal transduction histidine kinase
LGLHSTVTAFRVFSGMVSHEVRNLSGAAAVVHTRLGRLPGLAESEDYKALGTLVEGLEKIASAKLQPPPDDSAGVNLSAVLDDLRILLEPSLGEAGMAWEIPARLPRVRGDHHALLQVFLNLANNSIRAMEGREEKRLTLSAAVEGDRVVVRCCDTGPGVPAPESLFRPFQPHADGAGLGLYISHAMIGAFGGELRYEPQPSGCCFAVDLATAGGGRRA